MRLEQLVLFGPGDDFRVHFGSRVTVLAGLDPQERAGLIDTLVNAMAGRLPNASVIYVDHEGRRVFADRTGATYADDGVPAPALSTILGSDPSVVSDLVLMSTDEVGLGEQVSVDELEAHLVAARAGAEQVRAEHGEAAALVVQLDAWRADLDDLDRQIDATEDDTARWAWVELRGQLDGVRAELAAFDARGTVPDDVPLLAAVDQLREVGERWAEAGTDAAELAQRLGPLPDVSAEDLALVAATPDALPEDFALRLDHLQRTTHGRRTLEARLAEAVAPVPEPDEPVVTRLATLDQERLWRALDTVTAAHDAYGTELARCEEDVDPEVESTIEEAHLEVVRCQRNVERRFVPGLLGASALAVTSLLAGQTISLVLGVVLLAAAIAMAWWLLAVPRRHLAEAQHVEEEALGHANAGSWLGLHLRRIDDVLPSADRRGISAAMDRLATAQLDWEELTEGVAPDVALAHRRAIVEHAEATDPVARDRRERNALAAVQEARSDEEAARRALTDGLDGYGLHGDGASDLDPDQIRQVLTHRIEAGRFARNACELRRLTTECAAAAKRLDAILTGLGYTDGDLASRLERAIVAVEAARRRLRAEASRRTRPELEAELVELEARVEAGRRLSWDLSPEPTEPPADPDVLVARRRELSARIAGNPGPDLVEIARRRDLAVDRVRALEDQLGELEQGPASLQQRLTDRVARTSWLGDHEDRLPVLVDEALASMEDDQKVAALELFVRLSGRTQVVVLSDDPVVSGWAKANAGDEAVTLFEADTAAH